ncbi:MAG: hypothetical protein WBM09_11690 [Gallionella sp.]
MHLLKTHSLPTPQADTFRVYWTNSPVRAGGLLRVRVAPRMADAQIAAELAAIQYLLEDKGVLGNTVAGNAMTKLIVSAGAIRKLRRRGSDKLHLAPYANFLTTRFAGCTLGVDKDARWFAGFEPESIEDLVVASPRRETVKVAGLGEVSVTQHVLERFADRFLSDTAPDRIAPDQVAQAAWKKLTDTAADPSLREVARRGIWAKANYARQGKPEGRYFLNARRNLVLVIADDRHKGLQLVTAYPATGRFHPLPDAA